MSEQDDIRSKRRRTGDQGALARFDAVRVSMGQKERMSLKKQEPLGIRILKKASEIAVASDGIQGNWGKGQGSYIVAPSMV